MFHLFSPGGSLRRLFLRQADGEASLPKDDSPPQSRRARRRQARLARKSGALDFQTLEPRLLLSSIALEPSPISGSIDDPTDVDRYSFSTETAKTIVIDPLVYRGFQWNLENESGSSVASSSFFTDSTVVNIGRGTYSLSVAGNASTQGAYQFRILDLAQHSATIQPDETVDFTFPSSREAKAFQFAAVAGQRFFLDGTVIPPINGDWQVFDPNGQFVASTFSLFNDVGPFTANTTGFYTVIADGANFNSSSTSGQFVVRTARTDDNTATAFGPGDTVSGAIDLPGKQIRYKLDIPTGEVIQLDAQTASVALNLSVTNAEGATVYSRSMVSGYDLNDLVYLPPGSYDVVVNANAGQLGTFSLTARRLVADALPLNTLTTVVHPAGHVSRIYGFDANEGDLIRFNAISVDTPGDSAFSHHVSIIDGSGRDLVRYRNFFDFDAPTISRTGRYFVVIDSEYFRSTPSSLTFSIDRRGTETPLSFAAPSLGTLETVLAASGQFAAGETAKTFVFEVTEPGQAYVDLLGEVYGLGYRIRGPWGTVVGDRYDRTGPGGITGGPTGGFGFVDLGPGTYELTLLNYRTFEPRDYQLLLRRPGALATPLTLDETLTVPVDPDKTAEITLQVAETGIYQFSFGQSQSNGIYVLDATGRERLVEYGGSSRRLALDPGTYTIATTPSPGAQPGELTVRVRKALDASRALSAEELAGGAIVTTFPGPGDTATYGFTLAAPQRYLLVPDSNTDATWELIGPDGRRLRSGSFEFWSAQGNFLDLAAGSYQLRLTGRQDQTSAFRLIDLAAPAEDVGLLSATPAFTIGGAGEPRARAVSVVVDGTSGVVLDLQDEAATDAISGLLLSPDGRVIGLNRGARTDVPFPGTYTAVIASVGTGGNTVPVQLKAPARRDEGTLDLGVFTDATFTDRYETLTYDVTLPLGGGHGYWFDSILGQSGYSWVLRDSTNRIAGSGQFGNIYGYDGSIRLPDQTVDGQPLAVGSYRLEISASGQPAGPLRFRLLDLEAVVAQPRDSVFSYGLEEGGTAASVARFVAEAGRRYQVLGGGSVSVSVIDNDGFGLASFTGGGTFTAKTTGDVVVVTKPAFGTGEVGSFEVVDITDAITLALDDLDFATPFQIDTGGASRTVIVNVDIPFAGDSEPVAFLVKGGPSLTDAFRIIDTDGLPVADGYLSETRIVHLPPGQYRLVLSNVAGAGQLYFGAASGLETFQPGTERTLDFDGSQPLRAFQFDGTYGQRLAFQRASLPTDPFDGWDVVATVFDQSGRAILSGYDLAHADPGSLDLGQLPATGSYVIVFEARANGAGDPLQLRYALEDNGIDPPIAYGGFPIRTSSGFGTSTTSNDSSITFNLRLDTPSIVYFDARSGYPYMGLSLDDPWGNRIHSGSFGSSGVLGGASGGGGSFSAFGRSGAISGYSPRLLEPGNYLLTIETFGYEGPLSFGLFDLIQASDLQFDSPTIVQLLNPNEADARRFSAKAGEQFFFDFQPDNPQGVYWIIGPNGEPLRQVYSATVDQSFTAEVAGDYYIVIDSDRPNGDPNAAFVFTASRILATPTPIAIGEEVTRSLVTSYSVATYSFQVDQGTTILIDRLSTWDGTDVYAELFDDAGRYFGSTNLLDDVNAFFDVTPGQYRLKLTAFAPQIDPLRFVVRDVRAQDPDVARAGDIIAGRIDQPTGAQIHHLSLDAGDQIFLDVTLNGSPGAYTQWRLLDETGARIFVSQFADGAPFTVMRSGDYYLAIDTDYSFATPTDYTIAVRKLTPSAPIVLTYLEQVAGPDLVVTDGPTITNLTRPGNPPAAGDELEIRWSETNAGHRRSRFPSPPACCSVTSIRCSTARPWARSR